MTSPLFTPTAPRRSQNPPRPARRHFVSRVLQRLLKARQRSAERELASWVARHGGKFTDSIERQMERRLFKT